MRGRACVTGVPLITTLVLSLLVAAPCCSQEGTPPDGKKGCVPLDRLRQRFREIADRLNPFWPEEFRVSKDASVDELTLKHPEEGTIELMASSPSLWMRFRSATGEMDYLRHETICKVAWDRTKGQAAAKPAWTREEALQHGEAILRARYGKVPENVRIARWRPDFVHSATHPGTWWIDWHQTVDGYPCTFGGILLCLHETLGVYSLSDTRPPERCPTQVFVTREEAIRLAREVAIEATKRFGPLMYGTQIGELSPHPVEDLMDIQSGELCIVNPNWLYGRGGTWPKDPSSPPCDFGNRERRLAYLVEFLLVGGAPWSGSGGPVVSVYVDAEDRTILGGNFARRE